MSGYENFKDDSLTLRILRRMRAQQEKTGKVSYGWHVRSVIKSTAPGKTLNSIKMEGRNRTDEQETRKALGGSWIPPDRSARYKTMTCECGEKTSKHFCPKCGLENLR